MPIHHERSLGNAFGGTFLAVVASLLVIALRSDSMSLWPSLRGSAVELGDTTYRLRPMSVPAARGWWLRLLAAVTAAPGLFGQLFRRWMLNGNGLVMLRALALQIKDDGRYPALQYPAVRLTAESRARHDRMCCESLPAKKRQGPYNSILDYHAAFTVYSCTPSEVLERFFKAVDELPADLRVFAELVDRDLLRMEAYASSERYRTKQPLSVFDGIIIGIKDQVCVRGVSCNHGSDPTFGSGRAAEDDTTVAKLRHGGAIIAGLTLMTELGSSTLGHCVRAGAPVNPYDFSRYPGGSSCGSAVGIALGLFPASIGFDAGGSIRLPSAMCGIVGMKCTWGRVPVSQDACWVTMAGGPMACCAADAALFYEVIAEPDPEEFYGTLHMSSPMPPVHYFGLNDVDNLTDIKLGIYWDWFNHADEEVRARAEEVLVFFQQCGAEIVPIKIPHLDIVSLAHFVSVSAEMTFFNERQFWEAPEGIGPAARMQLAVGGSLSASELIASQWLRGWLMGFLRELFEEKGLSGIFTPTLGMEPPLIHPAAAAGGESDTTTVTAMLRYMFMANVSGLPCITMPAGLSKEGLPIGVQVIADHWQEHICLRLANALDIPKYRSVPPLFVDLLKTA